MLKIAVTESLEEGAQSLADDLIHNEIVDAADGRAADEAISPGDMAVRALVRTAEAFPAGVGFGLAAPLGSAGAALRHVRRLSSAQAREEVQVQHTLTGTVMLEGLQQVSSSAKLKQTAPDVQEKVIRAQVQGSPFEAAYVDTVAALQSPEGAKDLEAVARAAGISDEELSETIAREGLLYVPVEKYAQSAASPALLEAVSFSPEADSIARMKMNARALTDAMEQAQKEAVKARTQAVHAIVNAWFPEAPVHADEKEKLRRDADREMAVAAITQDPDSPAHGWRVLYDVFTAERDALLHPALDALARGMKKGVDILQNGADGRGIRVSNNAPWYQEYYKENGKAPNQEQLRDLAYLLTVGDVSAPKVEGWMPSSQEAADAMEAARGQLDELNAHIGTLSNIKDRMMQLDAAEVRATQGLTPEAYGVYHAVMAKLREIGGVQAQAARMNALLFAARADAVARVIREKGGKKDYTARDYFDGFVLRYGGRYADGGMKQTAGMSADQKLEKDAVAWEKQVDEFMSAADKNSMRIYRVMDTPLVFSLLNQNGFHVQLGKELGISHAMLWKVLREKEVKGVSHGHALELTPEMMKELPRALADPMMILRNRRGNDPNAPILPDEIIAVVDTKDKDGSTIIVPIVLKEQNGRYMLKTFFGKRDVTWFQKRMMLGDVLYAHKKRALSWVKAIQRHQSPGRFTLQDSFFHSIPTDEDLVKLREEYPGFYQRAWHGSPYDFDVFDVGAIGAGEGAQAHGWGLYAAKDRKVSEGYRERLKEHRKTLYTIMYDGKPIADAPAEVQDVLHLLESYAHDVERVGAASVIATERKGHVRDKERWDEVVAEFDRPLALYEENPKVSVRALRASVPKFSNAGMAIDDAKPSEKGKRRTAADAVRALRSSRAVFEGYARKEEAAIRALDALDPGKVDLNVQRPVGKLFEVEIPDDDVLLDEGLPFDEQPKFVQKKLEEMFHNAEYETLLLALAKKDVRFDEVHGDYCDLLDMEEVLAHTQNPSAWQKEEIEELRGRVNRELERLLQGDSLERALLRSLRSGREIYHEVRQLFAPHREDKEASLALNKVGIKGVTYVGQRDGRCFVIFDDQAISIIEKFNQEMQDAVSSQMAAVRKQYEGTPQWMMAPNGKPTNLTEEEWLAVRTPAFKAAFGDWEARARLILPHDVENLEEAAATARSVVGKCLTNDVLGVTAVLSNKNISKMVSASATRKSVNARVHALAVANVDHLFRHAVAEYTHKDRNDDKNIRQIHRMFAPFVVGNDVFVAKLTVKELAQEKEGNRLYSVEALEIKEASRNWNAAYNATDGVLTSFPQEAFEDIIASFLHDGNDHDLTRVEEIEKDAVSVTEPDLQTGSDRTTSSVNHSITQWWKGVNEITLAGDVDENGEPLPSVLSSRLAQEQQRAIYGEFSKENGKKIITLFAGANPSTMLHEMGHMFLDDLDELAQFDEASAKDLATVNEWAEWHEGAAKEYENTPWAEEFRAHEAAIRAALKSGDAIALRAARNRWRHERFARGFELYLYEGKAPSKALRGVFRRFKQLLRRIYQFVKDVGGNPSPEVEAVMARMIASQEEIKAAELDERWRPVEKMGGKEALDDLLGDDVADTYAKWLEEARRDAEDILRARVMKDLRKEARKEFKARVEAERERKRVQLENEPVYLAEAAIRAQGDERAALLFFPSVEAYKEERAKRKSPEEELQDAMEVFAKGLDEELMAAALSDENIARAMQTPEAYHRRVAIEREALRAKERLARYVGGAPKEEAAAPAQESQTGKEEKARADKEKRGARAEKESERSKEERRRAYEEAAFQNARYLRAEARRMLAESPISESCNPEFFRRKERSHARAAARAAARGRWDEALAAKDAQALAAACAYEAAKNASKVDALRKDVQKKLGARTVRLAPNERYWLHHTAYLLGLKSSDAEKPVDGKSLSALFDEYRENNDVDAADPSELLELITQEKRSYTAMRLGDFADVVDAMRILYTVGRDRNRMKSVAGKTVEEVCDEMMADSAALRPEGVVEHPVSEDTGGLGYSELLAKVPGIGEVIARLTQKGALPLLKPDVLCVKMIQR